MRKMAILAGLLMSVSLISCMIPRKVYVSRTVVRKPVPPGSAFRIVKGPPPRGALYIGTVTVNVTHADMPEVFNDLRREVQKVGGNLVAFFRCGARRDYIVTQDVDVYEDSRGRSHAETSTHVEERTEGFCSGKVFYIDPPPAPVGMK